MAKRRECLEGAGLGREMDPLTDRERTLAGTAVGELYPLLSRRAARICRWMDWRGREDEVLSDLLYWAMRAVVLQMRQKRYSRLQHPSIVYFTTLRTWRNIALKVRREAGELSKGGPVGMTLRHRRGRKDNASPGREDYWLKATLASSAPIPFQVAFRVDFPRWLSRLTGGQARAVAALAVGEKGKDAAREAGFSPARLSQLRGQWADELHELLIP